MAHLAESFKEKGNIAFRSGDFAEAEQQYTLAIQKYSKNPLLFTNRAFARLKLQRWDGVVDDCLHSIDLTSPGQNFKAYFYLAQAQLALHHPHVALSSALTAYEQVMHPTVKTAPANTSSTGAIATLVLKCKKAKFAARERDREQQRGDLLAEIETTLEKSKRDELDSVERQLQSGTMGAVEADERRKETIANAERKVQELQNVFAVADPKNHQAKEIPDWAVDTISFEIIHDPVMTKNGHSYERATILEHLKRSPTDPLTREPLTIDELRPNIALRKALDEFWEGSGHWLMDW